jgi:very-short-patch-repair endonuclease
MTRKRNNFFKSQATKRLKLVYEYAGEDMFNGNAPEVYKMLDIAGISNIEQLLSGPEFNMWRDLRVWGRGLGFYPEFPIGNDVVDFADPQKRIVIEVDSRLHDLDKDKAKDGRLKQQGYRVIRVNARNAKKDIEDLRDKINTLRDYDKHNEAEKLKSALEDNSEIQVMKLRNKFLEPRDETVDYSKTITLADYAKTPQFKRFIVNITMTIYLIHRSEQLKRYHSKKLSKLMFFNNI